MLPFFSFPAQDQCQSSFYIFLLYLSFISSCFTGDLRLFFLSGTPLSSCCAVHSSKHLLKNSIIFFSIFIYDIPLIGANTYAFYMRLYTAEIPDYDRHPAHHTDHDIRPRCQKACKPASPLPPFAFCCGQRNHARAHFRLRNRLIAG